MKTYKLQFLLLTVAQMVLTIIWFFFTNRIDLVIILSLMIYAGCMFTAFIGYEIEKYRQEKRELINNLP